MSRSYERGMALLELRRWKEAEEAFRQAWVETPSNGRLLALVALTQNCGGRPKEAEETARHALGLEEGSALAHYVLACCRAATAGPLEALPHAREARRLNAQNAEFHRLVAFLELRSGQAADALASSDLALASATEDAEVLLPLRATALLRRGELAPAERDTAAALVAAPSSPMAHRARAHFLLLARRIPEAEVHVREAIRLEPTSWPHRLALSELVFRRSRACETWLEQGRNLFRNPYVRTALYVHLPLLVLVLSVWPGRDSGAASVLAALAIAAPALVVLPMQVFPVCAWVRPSIRRFLRPPEMLFFAAASATTLLQVAALGAWWLGAPVTSLVAFVLTRVADARLGREGMQRELRRPWRSSALLQLRLVVAPALVLASTALGLTASLVAAVVCAPVVYLPPEPRAVGGAPSPAGRSTPG